MTPMFRGRCSSRGVVGCWRICRQAKDSEWLVYDGQGYSASDWSVLVIANVITTIVNRVPWSTIKFMKRMKAIPIIGIETGEIATEEILLLLK